MGIFSSKVSIVVGRMPTRYGTFLLNHPKFSKFATAVLGLASTAGIAQTDYFAGHLALHGVDPARISPCTVTGIVSTVLLPFMIATAVKLAQKPVYTKIEVVDTDNGKRKAYTADELSKLVTSILNERGKKVLAERDNLAKEVLGLRAQLAQAGSAPVHPKVDELIKVISDIKRRTDIADHVKAGQWIEVHGLLQKTTAKELNVSQDVYDYAMEEVSDLMMMQWK